MKWQNLILVSLALHSLCSLTSALAQTGNVGINTTSPSAMLHVKDSSVLFTGPAALPSSPGQPAVSGQGIRTMWYPNKAAFRTGGVVGPNWDKDSIGQYSFAAGYNPKAKGLASIAFGYSAFALGHYSTAMGDSTNATGLISTVIGNRNTAAGHSSFATGNYTRTNGHSSLTSGIGTIANGWHSLASGHYTIANGYASCVIGLNNDTIVASQMTYSATTPLFIIGNGNTPGSRKNAMVVRKDGRVGIGTSIPAARLHVQDSSVLFAGLYNSSSPADPPASGAGTRMMWYPDKAAFRAGHVTSSQWDKSNVGLFSFSAGYNTVASNNSAFCIGENSTASGYSSGALGWGAFASGIGSISLGRYGTAIGDYAMGLGFQATASGDYSTAMGPQSDATGQYSTAIGWEAQATSLSSIAVGKDAYAGNSYSVAIGRNTTASGYNATSLGYFSSATGSYSLSLGSATIAQGVYSMALGNGAKSKGYSSISAGTNTISNGFSSFVVGMFNDSIVAPQNSVTTTTPLFIVGNGTNSSSLSNALVVRKDGKVGIGTNAPDNKLTLRSDGAADTTEILLGLVSNTSNRPVLQFSETSTAIATSGMSIEYNGTGGFSDNKLHVRGTDAVRRFTIMNNGRVGIGTETASQELSISDIGNNGTVAIEMATPVGPKELLMGIIPSGGVVKTLTNTSMHLGTNDALRLTITVDGNVGIGTTSPTELLTVGYATGHGIRIGSAEVLQDAGSFSLSSNATILPATDNSYDIGSASYRWDDIWATNGIIQTSDARDKKDVSEITYGIEEIMQLRPVQYRWREGHNHDFQIGLLAQEVQQVLPEVVRSSNHIIEEDGTYTTVSTDRLGMNYASMTPVLIKAMQEQQRRIDTQQETLDKQQVTIDVLITRINELEELIKN